MLTRRGTGTNGGGVLSADVYLTRTSRAITMHVGQEGMGTLGSVMGMNRQRKAAIENDHGAMAAAIADQSAFQDYGDEVPYNPVGGADAAAASVAISIALPGVLERIRRLAGEDGAYREPRPTTAPRTLPDCVPADTVQLVTALQQLRSVIKSSSDPDDIALQSIRAIGRSISAAVTHPHPDVRYWSVVTMELLACGSEQRDALIKTDAATALMSLVFGGGDPDDDDSPPLTARRDGAAADEALDPDWLLGRPSCRGALMAAKLVVRRPCTRLMVLCSSIAAQLGSESRAAVFVECGVMSALADTLMADDRALLRAHVLVRRRRCRRRRCCYRCHRSPRGRAALVGCPTGNLCGRYG